MPRAGMSSVSVFPSTSSIVRNSTPSRLFDRIDCDDVGVVQRGDGTGLAIEPAAALRIGGLRMRENLQRDFTSQLPVLGEEYLAHASGADGADDPVVAERGRDHRARSVPPARIANRPGPWSREA